jgi:hypothetical protein
VIPGPSISHSSGTRAHASAATASTAGAAAAQSKPNRSAADRAPTPLTPARCGPRGALAKPDGLWGEVVDVEASGEGPDGAF